MTIMTHPVIVTPVQRRRSVISDIGCAIVNRGWSVINRWRIDGHSDEGRKPEADPNADPAVCPSRGAAHQNSGEYRNASHRPATSPSNNPAKLRQVHSFAFSLP
jgi:hypothetical protein